MSQCIREADWRVFRELRRRALERFCQRALSEVDRIVSDSNRGAHERYLAAFELLERRDRELANAFNDQRRSTAVQQLAYIKSLDLLTKEEMTRFSTEVRDVIAFLAAD